MEDINKEKWITVEILGVKRTGLLNRAKGVFRAYSSHKDPDTGEIVYTGFDYFVPYSLMFKLDIL